MKRLRKILLWLLGIFLGLILLTVVGIKLFFPAEKAKAMAIEKGSAALGRTLTVGDIEISFWGGLGLRLIDIKIDNPDSLAEIGPPLLVADGIDLKLRLWPLLSREIRVDRLIIERPQISLIVSETGQNNYTFKTNIPFDSTSGAPPVQKEVNAATAAVSFDQLEITDGSLTYEDKRAGTQARVSGLRFESSLATPRDDLFETRGKLSADTIFHSMLGIEPIVGVGISYAATYDLSNQTVTIDRSELSVGDFNVAISGRIDSVMNALSYRLAVRGEGIDIAEALSLLPDEKKNSFVDFSIGGTISINADLYSESVRDSITLRYSGTVELANVTARRRGLDSELRLKRALIDFKPDNIRMTIEEGSFAGEALKGHVVLSDFADPSLAGELGGSIDLAMIQPFVPALSGHEIAGLAVVDLKFSGRMANIEKADFSGTVKIADGRYASALLPEPLESFSCDLYLDRSTLNVRELTARFASGQLAISGRFNKLAAWILADSGAAMSMRPTMDITMKGNVDLALAGKFLPERGNPVVAGNLTIDLRLTGQVNRPSSIRPKGMVSISEGKYTDSLLPEPIEQFSAEMILTPDSIVVASLDLKFTTSDLSFKGILSDPFPYLLPFKDESGAAVIRPNFRFMLSSRRFDTDKLFPEAVPVTEAGQAVTVPDSVSMLFLPDIEGEGRFDADTILYGKVMFTDLNGIISFRDRQMTFSGVNARVFSGAVTGETTIDLSDLAEPRYSGTFSATNVEAAGFMDRFTSYGGYLTGKIDVSGSYDARGWEPEGFLNSLDMKGTGTLTEGTVTTSGTMYNIISQLAKQTGQSFAKEQSLRNLQTDYVVKDGKVNTGDFKTSLGNIGDIRIGGFYGFDSTLNYTGEILLTPELSKQLLGTKGVGGLLGGLLSSGNNDRMVIPLIIDGTTEHPNARLNWDILGEKAAGNLKKKAGSALKNLFKKKK